MLTLIMDFLTKKAICIDSSNRLIFRTTHIVPPFKLPFQGVQYKVFKLKSTKKEKMLVNIL